MALNTAEILEAFPRYSALVVGDICLDRWCTYDPATAEPSRETLIPRIGVVSTEVAPGGGGNVANNLAALCPNVELITSLGDLIHVSQTGGKQLTLHEFGYTISAASGLSPTNASLLYAIIIVLINIAIIAPFYYKKIYLKV